jgi:hypothetical protein
VQVEVIDEGLTPGVQHGEEPELTLQAPRWIVSEGLERVGDAVEQQPEQRSLVAEHERVQLVGQGEDEMEVSDGQQILLAFLEPTFSGEGLAFGAVTVAARVVAG